MGQMVCSDLAVLRNYPPHLTPQKQVGAPATPWLGSRKAGPRAPAIKRGREQSHYRGLCTASCCPRSQPGPALTPCGPPLGCLAHLCQWLFTPPHPEPCPTLGSLLTPPGGSLPRTLRVPTQYPGDTARPSREVPSSLRTQPDTL